jgi:hypothetical protein
LPATVDDLVDTYPDTDLTTTWLRVLERSGVVIESAGRWTLSEDMAALLVGDDSYADYLGGQILHQLAPRLTLGTEGRNVLASVLRDPSQRRGYEGWFEDQSEAHAYQASQYAGSLGPARAISKLVPPPTGRALDLGGGWGAIAGAIAQRHGCEVDVVDLEPVVAAAPPTPHVRFLPGSALDATTWPEEHYDGAVLSYLFSSVPGSHHDEVIAELAARGVRWIAIHDFVVDRGDLAAEWSLQHAVFVPGHRSFDTSDLDTMLRRHGYVVRSVDPVVDQMTAMVVGVRAASG